MKGGRGDGATAITGPLYGSADALAVTFDYDHMGRRIAKAFLSPDLSQSPQELMDESLSGGWKFWSDTRAWRFVYDGQSGSTPNGNSGWNLSASYMVTSATYPATGDYLGLDQSMAWGLDLSQSEPGAGGIGGLVIVHDERAFTLGEGSSFPGGPVCTVFPMYDGNGNMVSLRDASGYEQAGYQYGPFGQVLQSRGPRGDSNTWKFSTKYADVETGLVYYGYRYYSAGLGRWITRDPIGEADGANIFALTSNDPISLVDMLGLLTLDAECACDPGIWEFDPGVGPRQSADQWRTFAREQANINEALWGRLTGAGINQQTQELSKIYTRYAYYYIKDNRLLWAGLASQVGIQVIPAVQDADRQARAAAARTPPVSFLIRRVQSTIVRMAQGVFDDMAWQHEAYLAGGLPELRRLVDAGELSSSLFYQGWCPIALGRTRAQILGGNIVLLRAEQTRLQADFIFLRDLMPLSAITRIMAFMTSPPYVGAPQFSGDLSILNDRLGWEIRLLNHWSRLRDDDRSHLIYDSVEQYYHWMFN